jgi:hypothetical protein
MAKKRHTAEHWKDDPEAHDFPAAGDYLSLLLPETAAAAIVETLRHAQAVRHKAKDLLRASGLPLLPAEDPEVAKDIKRVAKGEALSPVLLIRGRAADGVALIVADGYHRICASYHLGEDSDIPCRLAWLPTKAESEIGAADAAPGP